MLYFTYALNGLLMIALPVALGVFLARRFSAPWRLFWVGAVTFVLSQVVHLPLNLGLTALFSAGFLPQPPDAIDHFFDPVLLGLTAGLTEELARYFVLRFWLKEARSFRLALMFGAGHGGLEAIFLGALALLAYIQLAAFRNIDLSGIIPPEQLPTVQEQVAAYWSAPWYASLLGAVERIFSLTVHLALAVMVMQAFIRGKIGWLWAAIGWHGLVDAVSVYMVQNYSAYATEAAIGVMALISLGIIFRLRGSEEKTRDSQATVTTTVPEAERSGIPAAQTIRTK